MTIGVFFQEYGDSSWVDWSNYLINAPKLEQRLESATKGQAGLLVLDSIELVFRKYKINGTDSPATTAFDESTLASKNRLMFQIRFYTSAIVYDTVFEGMADLTSISYPFLKNSSGDIINLISVTILDKLSAMAVLKPLSLSREVKDLVNEVNSTGTTTSAYLSGTVAGSVGSNVILGTGTSFSSDFRCKSPLSVDDFILVDGVEVDGSSKKFAINKIVSNTEIILYENLPKSVALTQYKRVRDSFSNYDDLYYPYWNTLPTENEAEIFFIKKQEWAGGGYTITGNKKVLSVSPLEVGDILAYQDTPYYNAPNNLNVNENLIDRHLFLVTEVSVVGGDLEVVTLPSTSIVYETNPLSPLTTNPADTNFPHYFQYSDGKYFDKLYYGQDIRVISGGVLIGFDGLALIEALIQSIWTGIAVTSADFSDYTIPLSYFNRLIDYLPFGKHPLEVIKMILGDLNAYMWYDHDTGNVVVRKRSEYSASSTSVFNLDLYDTKSKLGTKNYFWDKLVDVVNVHVKSWIKYYEPDGSWLGEYLDGGGTAGKFDYGLSRNPLDIEILANKDDLSAYGFTINENIDSEGEDAVYWENVNILNSYADLKASEYLSFYGRRHFSFEMTYALDYSMLNLRLGNVVTFGGDKYFVESFTIDIDSNSMGIKLVSCIAYDFDEDTVLYNRTDLLGSSGGSSLSNKTTGSSSSTVIVNDQSLTGIFTGSYEGAPIVADYLVYNTHNLSNDVYVGTPTYVSSTVTDGYAIISFSSAHSFRRGAKVTCTGMTRVVDGEYTILDIDTSTSIIINYVVGATGSDNTGSVVQESSLNTIQDIGILDEPQYYGLKLSNDSYVQSADYIPNSYVFQAEYKDTDPLVNAAYGSVNLLSTSYLYGDLAINLYDPSLTYKDISMTMNPVNGFDITQGFGSFGINESVMGTTLSSVDGDTKVIVSAGLSSYLMYRQSNLLTTPIFDTYLAYSFVSGSLVSLGYGVSPSIYLQRINGTSGAPEYITQGGEIGSINFKGYNPSHNAYNFASIGAYASDLHADGDIPTHLEFFTTPNGSDVALSRLVIDSEGRLGLGVAYDEIYAGRDITFNSAYGMGSESFTSGWMGGEGWYLEAESFGGSTVGITEASRVNGSYWLVTTNPDHGYSVGQRIIIYGCVNLTDLNGGYIVQSIPTSDTFTVLLESNQTYAYPDGMSKPVAYEYNLTVDNLEVRGTMSVWELLVQQIRVTNGNLLVTSGAKSDSAILNDGANYFLAEDITGHGVAPFYPNDIIMCQQVNLGDLTASDFETDDWVEIKLEARALIKRLVYRVSSVIGLKVYVDQTIIGAPTNKGFIEKGDSFARIGNTNNTDRQGMLGLFADAKDAPYMRITDGVTNWATWKSGLSTKVQIGKLDSIGIDQDFGIDFASADLGYGAYLVDNLFMKGNLVLKSNNQFDLLDGTISLGNILTEQASLVPASAIGISLISGDMEHSGIFGYDDLSNLIFALRLDDSVSPHNISNWKFNETQLWNTDDGTNATVRLEATTNTFVGLGVYDETLLQDTVKIGYMPSLEPTTSGTDYTSTQLDGEGFNNNGTVDDLDEWIVTSYNGHVDTYTGQYYAGTACLRFAGFTLSTYSDNDQVWVRQDFGSSLSSLQGKELSITIYAKTGTTYTRNWLSTVSLEQARPSPLTAWHTIGRVIISENLSGWTRFSFSAQVASDATGLRLTFRGDTPSAYSYPITINPMYFDGLKVEIYSSVITHISQDGFFVKNGPNNYLSFDGSLSIGTSDLKINGLPAVRWWGSIDDVDYLIAQPGDLALENDGVDQYIRLYDGSSWYTLFVSTGGALYQTIGSLDDVDYVSTPVDGEILIYDELNTRWINGTIGATIGLDDISDVISAGAATYDLLVYDSTLNGGLGAWAYSRTVESLTFYSGITTASQISATNGFLFDSTSNTFKDGATTLAVISNSSGNFYRGGSSIISYSGTPGTDFALTLGSFSGNYIKIFDTTTNDNIDVVTTGSGLFRWNSTEVSVVGHEHVWGDLTSGVPTTISGYGITDSLSPVLITSLATNDVLKYNGTNWVNSSFLILTDLDLSATTSSIDFTASTKATGDLIKWLNTDERRIHWDSTTDILSFRERTTTVFSVDFNNGNTVIAGTLTVGGVAITVVDEIIDLDVTMTSVAQHSTLRYNGIGGGWTSYASFAGDGDDYGSATTFARSDHYHSDYLSKTAVDTKTAGSLKFNDSIELYIGTGNDLNIYGSGTTAIMDIVAGSTLSIRQQDYSLIVVGTATDVRLYVDQSAERLRTTTAGGTLYGAWNLQDSNSLSFGTENDLTVSATGTLATMTVLSGSSLEVLYSTQDRIDVNSNGVQLYAGPAGAERIRVDVGGVNLFGYTTLNGSAGILDDSSLSFGTGSDSSIKFVSVGSHVKWTNISGVADWELSFNNGTSNELAITAVKDGSVSLYYNGVGHLGTTSAGGTLTGTWNATTGLTINGSSVLTSADLSGYVTTATAQSISGEKTFNDDVWVNFGTSVDGARMQWTNSSTTFNLWLSKTASVFDVINSTAAAMFRVTQTAVSLRYSGSEKFVTTNTGATLTGTLVADGITVGDNESIIVGSGSLNYNSTGTYFSINASSTNKVIISQNSETLAQFGVAADARLYYGQGSLRLQTTSAGGTLTGTWNALTDLQVNGTSVSLSGHTHTFASLTSKPTTMAGYGITDGLSTAGGFAMTGAITMNDSQTLLFGTAGNECEIYSNGTNTYINQKNTAGSLFLQNNGYSFIEVDSAALRLSQLTTNGFLKTSSSNGTLIVDTTTYLTSVTGGFGITVTGTSIALDLTEIGASTTDDDGDYFVVTAISGVPSRLTKANINLSGFNNDAGFLTSSFTPTSINLVANNTTDETVYLTFADGATGTQGLETDTSLSYNPLNNRLTVGSGNSDNWNSAYGWGNHASAGYITGVTAGTGLTGGASSGDATLAISVSGIATELTSGLVDTDEFIVSDGGTVKKMDASVFKAYFNAELNFQPAGTYLTGITAGYGISVSGTTNITINTNLNALTASTLDADGDKFVCVSDSGIVTKLTKGNINLSGFNNNSGWTSNTGTVTTYLTPTAGRIATFYNSTSIASSSYDSTDMANWATAYGWGNHASAGYSPSAGSSSLVTVGDIISGRTALTSGLVGTDELLVSDGGAIKKMDVSVLEAFLTSSKTQPMQYKVHLLESGSVSVGGYGTIVVVDDIENTITGFTGAVGGQRITIVCGGGALYMNESTTLRLAGNWSPGQYDSITLVYTDSTYDWIEVCRSDN